MMVVGGEFTSVNGTPRDYIARLYADGSVDATFNPGASLNVTDIDLQADGKILLAGAFTSVAGQPRLHIARLNADGTLDTAFNPGANGDIFSLAIQPDGKILVAGAFTTIAGQPRSYLARLNADGTLDTTFNAAPDNVVLATLVQPDGKIVAGGFFTHMNGQPRGYLARLHRDGSLDATFTIDIDDDVAGVIALALQPDGRILVGGYFSSVGGVTRNNIARIMPQGTLDETFDLAIPYSDENPGIVGAILIQADGAILIGGDFTSVAGVPRSRLARLKPSGALDTGFAPSANFAVSTIAQQPDGKILIGGYFDIVSGEPRDMVARLNLDGSLDATLTTGVEYPDVRALAVQPDGKILVGGNFLSLGGQTHTRIGRLNPDGSVDATFVAGVTNVMQCSVDAIVVQPDGKILLGGYFNAVNGTTRNNIARLNADGTLDPSFNPNANAYITAMRVLPDGKILIVGGFTSMGGVEHRRIARLYPDGTPDPTFTAGVDGVVFAMAVQPDGKIVVGGTFPGYLKRFNPDGSVDTSFVPGVGEGVYALAVQPDGKIILGGTFTVVGSVSRIHLARLNPNGTVDMAFAADTEAIMSASVQTLALQTDGKILVGGTFLTLGGQPRSCIGRLNPDGAVDPTFDPTANDDVQAIALQSDGRVMLGGTFTSVGGLARASVARLSQPTAAVQDLRVSDDGMTIAWERSGASPEVERVVFEISLDGTLYAPIGMTAGAATRNGATWGLTDAMLPVGPAFYIRARGYAPGGMHGGSVSICETVERFQLPAATPCWFVHLPAMTRP